MSPDDVLCVDRRVVERMFRSWAPNPNAFLRLDSVSDRPHPLTAMSELLYRARTYARTTGRGRDWSRKQLACFGVVCCRGRVFVYRRFRVSDRGRLHSRASIGICGRYERRNVDYNVIPPDVTASAVGKMRREFNAQLGSDDRGLVAIRPVGLVNDESTPAGRCHVGFVWRIDVESPEFVRPGPEFETVGWLTPSEFLAYVVAGNSVDPWSRQVAASSFSGATSLWCQEHQTFRAPA